MAFITLIAFIAFMALSAFIMARDGPFEFSRAFAVLNPRPSSNLSAPELLTHTFCLDMSICPALCQASLKWCSVCPTWCQMSRYGKQSPGSDEVPAMPHVLKSVQRFSASSYARSLVDVEPTSCAEPA